MERSEILRRAEKHEQEIQHLKERIWRLARSGLHPWPLEIYAVESDLEKEITNYRAFCKRHGLTPVY